MAGDVLVSQNPPVNSPWGTQGAYLFQSVSGSMRTTSLWVAVVAVGVLFAHLSAQNEAALEPSFESAMRAATPDWRADVVPVNLQQIHMQRWRRGTERLLVRHFVCESPEAAQQLLQDRIAAIPVASFPIGGIGDAAYSVLGYGPTGEANIYFTTGALVIEVSTVGENNARRFAALFLAEARRAAQRGPQQ